MKKFLLILSPALILLASCNSGTIREPEYRDIRDVRLINVGLLQTTASLDLIYYNPNNFGVQLSEARGDVYIDNAYLGRFEIRDNVKVPKRNEFIVPAILKLDNIGAVLNHRDIWKKKEALIRIDGIAILKKAGITKEVPIKFEGMQNIEKLRTLISK